MTSTDISKITGSEQEFRLYVVTHLNRLDIRTENLEKHAETTDKSIAQLSSITRDVREEVRVTAGKFDLMLGGIAIILGAMTLALTWWSIFKPRIDREADIERTIRRVVREMLPELKS